jgi:ATP-binding cassette subfamily B protein
MSDKYNILQSALVSCERIFHILDSEIAPEYRPAPPAKEEKQGMDVEVCLSSPPAIEFRDVWFSYGDSATEPSRGREPVLRGVSFEIREGEMGAIVGATGAGKTTILSLLCRLYEISRGRILLFGRDIREIPREELRRTLSLVLQDPFLFSGSIRENVVAAARTWKRRLGRRRRRIRGRVGRGMETTVGEREGGYPSGSGSLSHARALARDPKVLLLDEATSSVDPVTEHEIQKALANILAGRTSLVVAHRLSTILSADRIIVLHKGKVRETGTHRELMEARGIYQRLYMLQFEGGAAAPTSSSPGAQPAG